MEVRPRMEDYGNFPIQLFCVVSTQGELTPLQFRYEDEEHTIHTVRIHRVLSHKSVQHAGSKAILYTCTACLEKEQETYFEIKYLIDRHKWIFSGRLS